MQLYSLKAGSISFWESVVVVIDPTKIPFVFQEAQRAKISQKVLYFGIFWIGFVITDKEIPVEDTPKNAKHNH